MAELISTFVLLFAVIDPIGTIPVFIAITKEYTEIDKRKIAFRATLIATGILIFFLIAGELILDAINVSLAAFEVAGGLILLLFALTMIFGESKPDEEIGMIKGHTERASFPLATPSIASPGAMLSVVLLTKNDLFSPLEQLETALVLLFTLGITLIFMLLATKIQKLIGKGGASIISRVMGLILASIAVSNMLEGVKVYFDL